MSLPIVQVLVYFTLPAGGGDFFQLDHPTKGKLDDTTFVLAGDTLVLLPEEDVEEITFTRGRSRQLDEIPPGTGSIRLANPARDYDPFHVSSPYAGNLVPGKRVRVVVETIPIFDGVVADWVFEYDESQISAANLLVEDWLAVLGRMRFSAWTTTSQLPGERVNAVLDRPEVGWAANRAVDTGVDILQADNVSFGSNVLNYLQLVTKSDQGRFFATAQFGAVAFKDRNDGFPVVVQHAFADDGSGTPFARLTFETASTFLYNRVTVDREGGTAQTVTDTDSVDEYGWRPLEITGLLLNTDVQSLALANYLLNKYKTPEVRVAEVGVDLAGLPIEEQVSILRLELGEAVTVTFTPDSIGDPIVQYSYVEGLSHSITASGHTVVLSLGAADNNTFFQLDHSVFGELDSGNQLAF